MSPLVEIEEVAGTIDTRSRAGLLFTSANAVRIFARRSRDRGLKAHCVGETTTMAAIEAGLATDGPGSACETSQDLVEKVVDEPRSNRGPYLYVRGSPVARDLVSLLGARNVPVEEVVVYRQSPVALTDEARDIIQRQAACVPLYSRFAARRLADEIAGMDICDLACPCMSTTVGAPLAGIPGVSLSTAASPKGDEMLKLILNCCRLDQN